MFYIVYKITNIINNKIYIGVHKTKDINDDYMGSGKHLVYAQKKYGIENFKKEILEVFNNPEDMFNMESKLVNEEFVSRDDTYNLKLGGSGGWYLTKEQLRLGRINANKNGAIEKAKESLRILYQDIDWVKNRSEKYLNTMYKKYGNDAFQTFAGKKHTEETKRKISEANSKHQRGEGNSQYGTMWIHNISLKENKKIKKDEFTTYEQQGWIKGRKMKF